MAFEVLQIMCRNTVKQQKLYCRNNENDVFPILSRKREEVKCILYDVIQNPVLNGNWEKKQDVVKKVALQPLSISNNTVVDSVSTKTEVMLLFFNL